METKAVAKSKLNLTGLLLVLGGMISDPMFRTYFGDLIPEVWLSKIMFGMGWVVIYLRTFATETKISLNWKNPFKEG